MEETKDLIAGCPACGCMYKVPPEFRGRTLSCKKCGTPFKLEQPVGAEPEGVPQPKPVPEAKADTVSREDPGLLLGRLIVKYQYASERQVRAALDFQAKGREDGKEKPLGEILVMKGVVSQNQLSCLLSIQQLLEAREVDRRFGMIALRNGFATQQQVDAALAEQKKLFMATKSVKRIGDLLVESGVISQEQRDAILAGQSRMGEVSEGKEEKRAPVDGALKDAFEVTVSEDGLSALITPRAAEASKADPQTIKDVLAAQGITFGIVEDAAMDGYLKQGTRFNVPFKVAEGTPPVPAGEVVVKHHFDTDPLKVGMIKEGGYIDFKDRGSIPQVKEGDLLAEKVLPTDGVPGRDVLGQPIPPPVTKDVKLRGGKGAKISEDGMKVYAAVDGRPELRADGRVYVFSDLEIRGNVDLKTGHVDFQGNVGVSGTVQSGFRVRGGSLTANEILKADIETNGDVVVFGGIIGATVRAGGNLRARYVHEANIEVLGDIVVEKEIIDSRIETSGVCNVRKGHILSCQVQAKKGIEAEQVGSDASRPCTLVVGTNERARSEIERLKQAISLKRDEGKKLEARVKELDQETQKSHQDMGSVAQEQDRAMVKRRTLKEKLEAAKRAGVSDLTEEAERVLQSLDQEIRERDGVLDAFLDTQEKIQEEISELQQAIKTLEEEIPALEDEIASISEWSQADRGNPVVKVHGSIHQYTTVKGLYSTLILPESHNRVNIKEVKTADKQEWKMRLSRL